jgi:hypothetical protein
MGTKWIVRVDDNFHYGDEDERYRYGAFGNYDEAVSACRKIVGLVSPEGFEPSTN